MILCQKCGAGSLVLESRAYKATLRRKRKCENCGARWTTLEIDEAEYHLLAEARHAHAMVSDAAEALRKTLGELADLEVNLRSRAVTFTGKAAGK